MVLNFLIFNFNFNFWWLVNVIVVVNLTSICKPCIASDSWMTAGLTEVHSDLYACDSCVMTSKNESLTC